MKSYSNCSNAGEISIDLSDLFCSKLCLSPSDDHINNLKDYGDLQKRTNRMTVVTVNMTPLSLMVLQVGVNCKKRLIESFHQADLSEMQVINKNIKELNYKKNIYRTFKAINEN